MLFPFLVSNFDGKPMFVGLVLFRVLLSPTETVAQKSADFLTLSEQAAQPTSRHGLSLNTNTMEFKFKGCPKFVCLYRCFSTTYTRYYFNNSLI